MGGIMDIPLQGDILLSIYSIDYLLKCIVNEKSGNIIKLTPASGKVDMLLLHDPVVLLLYKSNNLEILPADVMHIDAQQSQVTLSLREKEVDEERRVFERYPVSMEVSARRRFSNKRIHLAVRDISLYGMGAVSQTELEVDELIDIDLITDKNMFYVSGQIIWKKSLGDCSEYGLKYTNYDISTKSALEEYLNRQKDYYLSMIPKAR
jgi:hypothetical protein